MIAFAFVSKKSTRASSRFALKDRVYEEFLKLSSEGYSSDPTLVRYPLSSPASFPRP